MEEYYAPNTGFLDSYIIDSFRKAINSSPIFTNHENYKHIFNLICVFLDRIDSSIRYLNKYSDLPDSEEDFINFLVYAAILRDGVSKLYENIFHKKSPFIGEKKFFSNAMHYNTPCFSTDTCPTDDDFFEYLRAMAFAHPYGVDAKGREKNRPFMQANERHFCPWVIVGNSLTAFDGIKDAVGVRIYSSADEESIIDVTVSFSALKKYVLSRYESIAELTKWAENGIAEENEKWKQIKVNRNQDPAAILHEIVNILNDRFENSYSVETVAQYLECQLTNGRNKENVAAYRKAIILVIPTVCDCVDILDYEGMENAISPLFAIPEHMHKMAHYQLEKIFTYLDYRSEQIAPTSNEYWGLLQAHDFYQEFANKWVVIDVDHMSYDEIKLLVRVACFMEAHDQQESSN